MRLDHLLVERGFAHSRSRAQDMIRRGIVRLDGHSVLKTGHEAKLDAHIEVLENHHFVSRGALKLIEALDAFQFSPQALVCLDAGASTGGFTEVLLQRGAAKVYAVDVGRGQLHPSLRQDARVVSMEGTGAGMLTPAMFKEHIGAICCDVSFISLLKVLPALLPLTAGPAWLVALIKPQFEVGPPLIGKGGIVKDEGARKEAAARVARAVEDLHWTVCGMVPSPILGRDGNEETLLGATKIG